MEESSETDSKNDNSKKKKGVSFAEEAGGTKSSFLAGLGGNGAMWGVVEGITANEEGMGTDPQPQTEEEQKRSLKRAGCYNCFKACIETEAFKSEFIEGKVFCSAMCCSVFED